jgi:hypothetical protein
MGKRVATFGDCHGRLDLLEALYKMLEHESIDEIRHSGDLIDRGPDSAGCVSFCRENKIQGVMGNHEGTMLERYIKKNNPPPETMLDKFRTYNQLMAARPEDRQYLIDQPLLHVDDEIKTCFVHGGLLPFVPFHAQAHDIGVCFRQMIHPEHPGETRWFTRDKKGRTEQENRKAGWKRWYEVYDHPYNVVFGHAVFRHKPLVYKPSEFAGYCIGVDTGAWWCGQLTAVILPEMKFVSTPFVRDFSGPEGWEFYDPNAEKMME